MANAAIKTYSSPIAGWGGTANGANIGATTVYAVPAGEAGMYRVTAHIYQRATGTASVLPTVDVVFTENGVAITTGTSTGAIENQGSAANAASHLINTNNANATTACGTGTAIIHADASTNIQIVTAGGTYAGMTYDIYVTVERLQ